MSRKIHLFFLSGISLAALFGCQAVSSDVPNQLESSQGLSEFDSEWLAEEVPFDGEYLSPVARPVLLDEGSCQHLACESAASKPAQSGTPHSIYCPDGTRHPNQHRLVSFSCLGTSAGCNDDELWLAVPKLNCRAPETYIVCYGGKSVRAQARDTSDRELWEANRGVQKVLGIPTGSNPRVRIYADDVDVSIIPACSDPCVKLKKGACGMVDGQFCNRCANSQICLPDTEGMLTCQPLGNECSSLQPGACIQLNALSSCGCQMGQECVPMNGSMGGCIWPANTSASVQFGSGGSNYSSAVDRGRCDASSARAAACLDFGEWSCEWSTQSCNCGCTKVTSEW